MYPFYNQHMVEEHRQTLQREAEMVRKADSLYPTVQEKIVRSRIAYILLGGLARSNYVPSPFNGEQVYSDAHMRTKALIRTVGLATLGVGLLLGGWLGSMLGLLIPVLFGGIITLMLFIPVVIRLSTILWEQMIGLVAHREH